jgi:hypothetical protein
MFENANFPQLNTLKLPADQPDQTWTHSFDNCDYPNGGRVEFSSDSNARPEGWDARFFEHWDWTSPQNTAIYGNSIIKCK